jgi:Fe-S cluster assembly protein SufD
MSIVSSEAIDRVVGDFRTVEAGLPGRGAAWLDRARLDALDWFAGRGFPTARDEDWKYTNASAIERRLLKPARGSGAISAEQVRSLAFAELPCHLLVFVDGHFDATFSSIGALPAGVSIRSLKEVIAQEDGQRIEQHLTGEQGNAFAALNVAFMTDGVVIELDRNAVVELPIHLLYVANQSETSVHYRNLIIAGENAQATVVEHYAGPEASTYLTNAVTTIVGAANSFVEHYKLQQESTKAFHVGGIHATQARGSRFTSHSIALGGAIARNDITSRLGDEGAECTLNGFYMGGGRQIVDHHTRVDHVRPRGTSREFYRGVLDGAARGIFNGKVFVHPDAQKTDAAQSNHNLLLSKAAEVDTKPQLEIFADDVKCNHGATVGQLDDNMIFYLRSRGIEPEVAKALLIYAFAHDIIGRIRLDPLKHRIERYLISVLPEGERIKELL